MKLNAESRQKLEAFFSSYYKDQEFALPELRFHSGRFLGFFMRAIRVEGLALGRRIFIAPRLLERSTEGMRKLSRRIAAHEAAHTLQYKRLGFARFLRIYLREFWNNLKKYERWDANAWHKAYLDIPLEREARVIERDFVDWCKRDELARLDQASSTSAASSASSASET